MQPTLLFLNNSLIEVFCLAVGLKNIPNSNESIKESGLSIEIQGTLFSYLSSKLAGRTKDETKIISRISNHILFVELWKDSKLRSKIHTFEEAVRVTKAQRKKTIHIVHIEGRVTWENFNSDPVWRGDVVYDKILSPLKNPSQVRLKFFESQSLDVVPEGVHAMPSSVIAYFPAGFNFQQKGLIPEAQVVAVVTY